MKRVRVFLAMLAILAGISAPLWAQEKSKADAMPAGTTLKVQVTIAEMEGEKKVVSLPYTYFLRAGDLGPSSPWTKLRMGSRIPVYVGKDAGMQYLDVGTNIDSRAVGSETGRFDVTLNWSAPGSKAMCWSLWRGARRKVGTCTPGHFVSQ